ncbi:conserved protein of unknown function [Pseudodesulfovibrio profundus]|uniref:DUF885 domain-containing protein n=1 Tax=Pseudodesulfovibrio profundus TaxID=57320 RepID=A0A2C8FBX8_9BACT|nr:DUF885 family protein [Pseudodesulfovibrio profundus]SOB59680.1 conserved protein of unknown function [Pseudodesulfovibrio profundus]
MFKFETADRFFAYIGKYYPVMCSSGAFPLMPPVADAANWLDRYDEVNAKAIAKHLVKLKKFRSDFETMEIKGGAVANRATAHALAMCASAAIAELEIIRTWETSPDFYLRIAFTGLDQAMNMPAKSDRVREKRFLKRLKAIPALLAEAENNIEAVTPTARGRAQTMIRDCARYVSALNESDLGKAGKAPRYIAACSIALRDYDRLLSMCNEIPEREGPAFEVMLRSVLGTQKTPDEIFTIAEAEYERRVESIRFLESEIGTPWATALEGYAGPAREGEDAIDCIVREVHRLRNFIFESPLAPILEDSSLRIAQLPQYLAATLRPIHYDPALQSDIPSHCFVSPQLFSGRGFRDDPTRLGRIRREYLFMAARQSYPGRHLLDTQRRGIKNSPLAQITNPLFMEGWSSFAEDMLEELGYLEKPLDRLVLHQRGRIRAALAMIDAGLAVGNLDQDKCLNILMDSGCSKEESLARVRSIRLEPGNRVMPVLGLHEIRSLRRMSKQMLPQFCNTILSHGQISFTHLGEIIREQT